MKIISKNYFFYFLICLGILSVNICGLAEAQEEHLKYLNCQPGNLRMLRVWKADLPTFKEFIDKCRAINKAFGLHELGTLIEEYMPDYMKWQLRRYHKWTLLQEAVEWDRPDIVEYLADINFDFNLRVLNYSSLKDFWPETVLHIAVRKCDKKMVKLLLEKGANPNIRNVMNNEEGDTPLNLAMELDCSERKEIVHILLQYQADVNAISWNGITPLRKAVEWKDEELIDFLLQHGADLKQENHRGESALSVARNKCYKNILAKFQNHLGEKMISLSCEIFNESKDEL